MNLEDKYEAVLVCGIKGCKAEELFDDNMHGNCLDCGTEVIWRPHSPHGPEVAKLCFVCAMKHVVEMGKRGTDPDFVVTKKTSEDFSLFREQEGKGL